MNLEQIRLNLKERMWDPQPAYSKLRDRIVAIVYHWGASFHPKIGRVAKMSEMWSYYARTLAAHSYNALVRFEILQTMPWEMSSGALGLDQWEDYPPETIKRFGVTSWANAPDRQVINVLMMEDDEEGRFSPDTIYNARMLAAYLCASYQLDPLEDVLRHTDITHKGIRPIDHRLYDPSEKPCPRFYVKHESLWDEFKLRIKEICVLAANGGL